MEPKNSYTKEDLILCGQGEMFGEGNCRLPSDNMLMMDRIISITDDGGEHGKGQIIAELDIDPSLWFFDCHFKGDPVMPGCLGLDAMWQLVGFFLGWSGGPGLGRGVTSTYIHLSKLDVKVGEKITQGMKVAEIGATGRVTGPHLDWRFNWQGERLDPALLMQDTLANKK